MSGIIRRKKPKPSLFNAAEAEICPPVPVFRHPFFRRLRGLLLAFVILLVFPGCLIWPVTLIGFLALGVMLAGIWGFLGVTTLHGRLAGSSYQVRRLKSGHRFLCPQCLEFGGFRYGCGACGEEMEPFVIHTGGCYLNDCPHCHARVFRGSRHPGNEPNAFCEGCGSVGPLLHHQRKVRVLAVLRSAELDRLQAAAPGIPESSGDLEYLRLDDGERFTYILALGEPLAGEAEFPARHAAFQVEALWLGAAPWEPLALAEALDRFIRRARLSESRRRKFPVYADAAVLETAAREQLLSRFPNTRFSPGPVEFLSDCRAELLPPESALS